MHSTLDRRLGCFHFGVIANNTAMNTVELVSLDIQKVSIFYISRRRWLGPIVNWSITLQGYGTVAREKVDHKKVPWVSQNRISFCYRGCFNCERKILEEERFFNMQHEVHIKLVREESGVSILDVPHLRGTEHIRVLSKLSACWDKRFLLLIFKLMGISEKIKRNF